MNKKEYSWLKLCVVFLIIILISWKNILSGDPIWILNTPTWFLQSQGWKTGRM